MIKNPYSKDIIYVESKCFVILLEGGHVRRTIEILPSDNQYSFVERLFSDLRVFVGAFMSAQSNPANEEALNRFTEDLKQLIKYKSEEATTSALEAHDTTITLPWEQRASDWKPID